MSPTARPVSSTRGLNGYDPEGPLRLVTATGLGDDKEGSGWLVSWRLVDDELRQEALLGKTDRGASALAWSADGGLLAVGGLDETVRVWDVARWSAELEDSPRAFLHTWRRGAGADGLDVLEVGPRRFLATGSCNTSVDLWEDTPHGFRVVGRAEPRWAGRPKLTSWTFRALGFLPPEVASELGAEPAAMVASGARGRTAVWTAGSGERRQGQEWRPPPLRRLSTGLPTSERYAAELAVSPDGALLAMGMGQLVRTWELRDGDGEVVEAAPAGEEVLLLRRSPGSVHYQLVDRGAHGGQVFAVDFSPDGGLLATGSEDATVGVWTVRDGGLDELTVLPVDDRVWSVAFSPDGAWLAAGREDGRVSVWRTGSWDLLGVGEGHEGNIKGLGFLGDGMETRYLLSASDDETLRVWSLGSGVVPEAVLYLHDTAIYALATTDDSRTVVTLDRDCGVVVTPSSWIEAQVNSR